MDEDLGRSGLEENRGWNTLSRKMRHSASSAENSARPLEILHL
jgi:hypothetical protein